MIRNQVMRGKAERYFILPAVILVSVGDFGPGNQYPRNFGPGGQYTQESSKINRSESREFGPGTDIFV